MAFTGDPRQSQSFLAPAVLAVLAVGMGLGYYVTSTSVDMVALVFAGFFVFAFSFLNRTWALYFLVVAMIFSPEFQVAKLQGARAVTLRAEDFLIIIIMTGWLANIAVERTRPVFRSQTLNIAILVYIQVILVATLLGVIAGRAEFYAAFFYTLKYIEYFLLYFFVLNTRLSLGQLKFLVVLHILMSVGLGLFGMSQIGSGARVTTPFEGTSEPATMGGVLVFASSITLAYAIHARGMITRVAALAVSALFIPPLLYTLSRASYLAFAGSLVAMFFMSFRKPIVLVGMIALVIVLLPLTPELVLERALYTFEGSADTGIKVGDVIIEESAALRLKSYRRVLERLPNAPVFGFGVKGAGFIDGEYFRVLGETGIAGFLCFLFVHGSILRYVFGLTRTLKSDFARPLAVGFFVGHIGLLFHATGSSTFIIIRNMEPFWFLLALLCHFDAADEEAARREAGEAETPAFDRRAWIQKNFGAPKPPGLGAPSGRDTLAPPPPPRFTGRPA